MNIRIPILPTLLSLAIFGAHAGDDAKTVIGSGLGAAAGTAIGQSVSGNTGGIVGGALGGAVGAAATTKKGDGRSGAVIGGAAGGAAGAAVGQHMGGNTGGVLGSGLGAAAGAGIGKNVTEKDKPAATSDSRATRASAVPVSVRNDDARPYGKKKHKKHPPGHAYGHYKHDRD